MLARVHSIAVLGLATHLVEVEAVVSPGLPRFDIVGLPDAAVSESRDRVRCALRSSGLRYPEGRITINLAPADLKKEGPAFDLAIALAIAAASGELEAEDAADLVALGELSLDGRVRGVPGVLPVAIHHHRHREGRRLLLPAGNAREAAHVRGLAFFAVASLADAVDAVRRREPPQPPPLPDPSDETQEAVHDFAEVRGQALACRAMQVLAAGGHNALMVGPPGSGKSMVAHSLPGILPRLSESDALEVTQVYSVAGALPPDRGIITRPPFRAPHHSCSPAGLIGGGSNPRPGEISLAHRGVLFLDEALEFPRFVLETLRQPLESGVVTLSRAQLSVTFPARIMLLLALNPCPCGYFGDPERLCTCTPLAVERYRGRLSGPLLDRVDLHLEVARRKLSERDHLSGGPSSARLAEEVGEARARQAARRQGGLNAHLLPAEVERLCKLSDGARRLLACTSDRLAWSHRTHQRVVRVARTLADLEGSARIADAHVEEAIVLRRAGFSETRMVAAAGRV
jgi:magnesium chelatase family protein